MLNRKLLRHISLSVTHALVEDRSVHDVIATYSDQLCVTSWEIWSELAQYSFGYSLRFEERICPCLTETI